MKIQNPINFFDLETTGTSVDHDRIVQIAITKIHPDGSRDEMKQLINPGIPIPQEATDVHGITNEMVADQPMFKAIAQTLFDYFFGCDLAGYNSNNFDIPMLIQEFHRVDIEFPTWDPITLDGMKLETVLNPRTLSAVFERYTGKKLDDAHQADADVGGTITVLDHQMKAIREQFPDVLDEDGHITPEALEKFITGGKSRFDYSGKCYVNDDGVVCWGFGKNRDQPVLDPKERNYLNWVLNANFPAETKTKLKKHAEYMRPTVSFLGRKTRIDRSDLGDEFDIDFDGAMKVKFKKVDDDVFVAIDGMDGRGQNIKKEIENQKLIIK